jgi:hypothetical protein
MTDSDEQSTEARHKGHEIGTAVVGVVAAAALIVSVGLLSACEEVDSGGGSEKQNDTPAVVKAGAAFEHDNFKAKKGWRVVKDKFVKSPNIKKLKVTNAGGDQRIAELTFRFYKGTEVLAEVDCISNEMQKGEASALACFSTSNKFPKRYKTIKVSDMW